MNSESYHSIFSRDLTATQRDPNQSSLDLFGYKSTLMMCLVPLNAAHRNYCTTFYFYRSSAKSVMEDGMAIVGSLLTRERRILSRRVTWLVILYSILLLAKHASHVVKENVSSTVIHVLGDEQLPASHDALANPMGDGGRVKAEERVYVL